MRQCVVCRDRAVWTSIGTLLACAGTSTSLADAVWIDPFGGNWSSPSNWQGSMLPNNSQVVYFDQRAGGTALTFTVDMNGTAFSSQCKALFVQTNAVTLDFGPGSENLTLQGNSPSSASLVVGQKNISGTDYAGSLKIVNSGAFDFDYLSGSDATIGTGPGPAATFIVRGSGRADLGPMTIGAGGAGVVSVENDGDLNAGTATVGTSAAGTGQVVVTDGGSTADFSSLILGAGGTGTASVTSGGDLYAGSLVVGQNAAGSGLLSVSGSGSTAAAGSATVGAGGTGTVTVGTGGAFNPSSVTIGSSAVGSGQVTVSGSGSTANVSGTTTVGGGGSGTLTINTGADLTGATLTVGATATGAGQFTVTGAGSTASFSGTATIGDGSTGVVTISAGAQMSANSLRIGDDTAGSGHVTVSGAGSTLSGSGFIGSVGTGSLLIENGAAFTGNPGVGSSAPTSHGTITVDGAGSVWNVTGLATIGFQGHGEVIISNGGAVTSPAPFYIAYGSVLPTCEGIVEVRAGSTLTTGLLQVGTNTPPASKPDVGNLILRGGSVNLGSSQLVVNGSGALSGRGTITSTSSSSSSIRGEIAPRGDTPTTYGTLTLNMAKVAMDDPFLQDLPTVRVRVRGDDGGPHDQLVVSGELQLKGALIVESEGSLPDGSNALSLPLITAGSFKPGFTRFPAALLPALPDGRFYRVTYPEVGGSVTLNVQSLFNSPNFGDSASSSVNATITAADRGDLDDDGLDDLAVTTSDGFVYILIGNGDGTFSQTIQLPVGNDPRGVVIVDLDPANPNDNGRDLVVSNSADDTLTVYSRNGVGTWFVSATPATGDAPMGLCAADIDGDGDVDVAVADSGSDTVSFLRGQSTLTVSLATRTAHNTDDNPVDVDPWDTDNTKGGAQSLVTSNRGGDSMSFLVNNGGGFDAPLDFDSGAGPFQVVTGDFNLDGSTDAATLCEDGTMTVFISDGAGSFLDGALIPVGDNPLSFARADLDLDGDLDLAVIAENESDIPTVKVFRNDTDPIDNNLTLASPSEVTTATPQIVLTGMVDADTRPDIITVGSGPRTLTTITSVANSSFCPSDYNRDGFVTGDDFDEFIYEFEQGTGLADFNRDGFVTGDDFDGFVAAFEQGC